MKKTLVASLCVIFVLSLSAVAFAKNVPSKFQSYKYEATPETTVDLPPDLRAIAKPSLQTAAADTFNLGWFSFDVAGQANPQGWLNYDRTEQLALFWHVAEGNPPNANGELDGGTFGNLLPLEGNKSAWCGVIPSSADPYCGFATLPGYGNGWDQIFNWAGGAGDSVTVSYKVFWDSEPGYDATSFQYSGDGGLTWLNFPVGQGQTATANVYDGGPATLVETFSVGGLTSVDLRFRFVADGAWSDEDGLWPTDGAIIVDSITVQTFALGVPGPVTFSDFEAPVQGSPGDGIWTAAVPLGRGDFGGLYPGITVLQEDPCFNEFDNLWGWFDDPLVTNYACHTPDPRPEQGAFPFGNAEGVYMYNEIWSPLIPNVGAGAEYILYLRTYRDLPLDNLQFYIWSLRSWVAGCPTVWGNDNFVFYGGQKDWLFNSFQVGAQVAPGATDLQLAIGAIDACGFWCNLFGSGACHSHAPLIDDIHLQRVNTTGPQFVVRQLELFEDNFPENGEIDRLPANWANADAAQDVAPGASPTILPGDSVTITVTGAITDPNTGTGPAIYLHASVWPQGSYTGAQMESADADTSTMALRYPLVGSFVEAGVTWYTFRFDTSRTGAGAPAADRYCVDLNDSLFIPGDTVCYFFSASDGASTNYWSRRLNGQGGSFVTADRAEAAGSPCEFSILPQAIHGGGGDILYVDDSDDRGGPVQLFFDTAFDQLGILEKVDRYDVLGPSSNVGNGLESRVKAQSQINSVYRKIIWCSGNLSTGLVGDGGTARGGSGSEKTDSWFTLFNFVDQSSNNPGVYLSGDDLASEWARLTGASAVAFKSVYMNYITDPAGGPSPADNNHVIAGEPVSPTLDGVGPACTEVPVDQHIAYGGCALINDFDLLVAQGLSVNERVNASSGRVYALSQTTPNSGGSTARVYLQGYSYHYIRDLGTPGSDLARVKHLRHVLDYFVNALPDPVGIDTKAQFANRLDNNYPNPFNPTTTIAYSIKDQGQVSLKVYNAAGQLVRTLVNDVQTPQEGGFSVQWNGKNNAGQTVSSGVYFYKLVTNNFTQTKKMVLLK